MNPPSTQKRVLQQARDGDPAVICGLLNHKFEPEGITTQVRWQGRDRLRVRLESTQTTDAATCMAIIERGFKRLQIPRLAMLDVAGYLQGSDRPLWQQQLSMVKTAVAIDLASWLESGSSLTESMVALPVPAAPTALAVMAPDPEQKYLSFTLGIENPGLVAVETIQEILYVSLIQLLPVPDMPDCVVGIHNWRGEMLWIVDLNHLLGLGGLNLEELATVSVIVLRQGDRTIGLMVQSVGEIFPYDPHNLQPPTGLFNPVLEPFIVGYLRESSSIVLDTQAVFKAPELRSSG